jgi:hypothetical protein
MLRGATFAFLANIVLYPGILLSLLVAVYNKSLVAGSISLGAVVLVVYLLNYVLSNIGRKDMSDWLKTVRHCQYKSAWDGYGIAVDTATHKVHLVSRFGGRQVSKIYKFEDLRAWRYEIPGFEIVTGPRVIGGGLLDEVGNVGSSMGAGAATLISAYKSIENTGLYIEVKDREYPVWFVKFRSSRAHDKKTHLRLARWMELLNRLSRVGDIAKQRQA